MSEITPSIEKILLNSSLRSSIVSLMGIILSITGFGILLLGPLLTGHSVLKLSNNKSIESPEIENLIKQQHVLMDQNIELRAEIFRLKMQTDVMQEKLELYRFPDNIEQLPDE